MLGYFGLRKIEIRELSAHYFCFKLIVLSVFPHRKVGNFERFFLNNELLPFQLGPLDQVMNESKHQVNHQVQNIFDLKSHGFVQRVFGLMGSTHHRLRKP